MAGDFTWNANKKILVGWLNCYHGCSWVYLIQPFLKQLIETYLINIAICGLGLGIAHHGLGTHTESISDKSRASFTIRAIILYMLFDTGTFIARLLVTLFFARIFNTVSSRFKSALWVVQGLNVACYLSNILIIFFGCSPIKKYWIPDTPGVCLDLEPMFLAGDIPILVLDLLILLLPLPMLWKLQMTFNRKLLVVGVFIFGYLWISSQVENHWFCSLHTF